MTMSKHKDIYTTLPYGEKCLVSKLINEENLKEEPESVVIVKQLKQLDEHLKKWKDEGLEKFGKTLWLGEYIFAFDRATRLANAFLGRKAYREAPRKGDPTPKPISTHTKLEENSINFEL